jgi:hypothetical protein
MFINVLLPATGLALSFIVVALLLAFGGSHLIEYTLDRDA